MSAKHTPEPWKWKAVEREDGSIFLTRGYPGGGGHEAFDFYGEKSTAERFVACVNALAGVENPSAVKDVLRLAGMFRPGCLCHVTPGI